MRMRVENPGSPRESSSLESGQVIRMQSVARPVRSQSSSGEFFEIRSVAKPTKRRNPSKSKKGKKIMAKSRRRRRTNTKPSGPHGTGARTGGVMYGPGRAEAAASKKYRRSLAAKKAAATRKRNKRRRKSGTTKRKRKLHGAALAAWRRAHGYTKKGHKSMARKRRKGRSGRRRRKLHGAALAAFNRKHPHRKRGRRKPPRRTRGMFRRRNPAMPLWLKVMIGAGAGLLVAAGSKAAARRFFPNKQAMVADVAALAAIGAGVYLAKKRPFIGAGIAAGAAVGAVAPMLSAKLEGVGAAPGSPAAAASLARLEGIKYLEAVTADHLGAAHPAAAAFSHANPHASFMSAVTADDLAALSFDY